MKLSIIRISAVHGKGNHPRTPESKEKSGLFLHCLSQLASTVEDTSVLLVMGGSRRMSGQSTLRL